MDFDKNFNGRHYVCVYLKGKGTIYIRYYQQFMQNDKKYVMQVQYYNAYVM
jgi:hypothetical protein